MVLEDKIEQFKHVVGRSPTDYERSNLLGNILDSEIELKHKELLNEDIQDPQRHRSPAPQP